MRSVLEAKWAYLFDKLGIKYLYEPRKFNTSAGGYIPDFLLTRFNIWLEIKPLPPTNVEKDKIISVSKQEQIVSLIFAGFPELQKVYIDGHVRRTITGLFVYIIYPDGKITGISGHLLYEKLSIKLKPLINVELIDFKLISATTFIPIKYLIESYCSDSFDAKQ
jgi:hypothetical protein